MTDSALLALGQMKDAKCHLIHAASGTVIDQTCASIIANRLGMQFLVPHETYFSYWAPVVKDSVVLLAQGM